MLFGDNAFKEECNSENNAIFSADETLDIAFNDRKAALVAASEILPSIPIGAEKGNGGRLLNALVPLGSACVVCGFDSAAKYEVPGIIHAHHVKPLADRAGEYVVDSAIDLAPVCPNCHMLIHSKKGGVMSIEEARAMVESAIRC